MFGVLGAHVFVGYFHPHHESMRSLKIRQAHPQNMVGISHISVADVVQAGHVSSLYGLFIAPVLSVRIHCVFLSQHYNQTVELVVKLFGHVNFGLTPSSQP